MRVASIRDVQHRLKQVLSWIAAGQSVEVTSHGKVVARIVPPEPPATPRVPDFLGRLKQDFPEGLSGEPLSRIIQQERDDAR